MTLAPSSVFFLVVVLLFRFCSSMSDSEALLKLKQSFTDASALDSWVPGSGPCADNKQWRGLACSHGSITGLLLAGMGLSGKLDVEPLIAIATLRTINIVNNSFSGSIPQFNRLGGLKAIFLTGNQFSGDIPSEYFSRMGSLRSLWLSDNEFTGSIPISIQFLSHISELHLENNQFNGTIPDFNLPGLKSFNVSNNKLQGEIPDTLTRFGASAFVGNKQLCGAGSGHECDIREVTFGSTDNSHRAIAVILSVATVVITILVVTIFLMKRRKEEDFDVLENVEEPLDVQMVGTGSGRRDASSSSSSSSRSISSSRRGSNRSSQAKNSMKEDMVVVNEEKGIFGMSDLMKAAAEVLGTGSLGSAYKAVMASGIAVVVKRMKEMNRVGKEGFDQELRRMGTLRHPNVLNPLGYHYRKEEKLIIYEYIPKGSLLFVLHGDRGPSHAELNWPARLRIVHGIARGLGYLHTELASSLDLPHGNLKSSNVLLTFDYDPLLSDYGYSPLISVSFVSQALFAYKAPEAVRNQQISPKCDVYCLGVVILEILIGKYPTQYLNTSKGGTDVVQCAETAIIDGREADVLDPEISGSKNSVGEMVKLLHIAVACTESDPIKRLDLKEAIRRIEDVRVERISCRGAAGAGASHSRAMHVQPSLRDGGGDAPATSTQPHPREDLGEMSLNQSHISEENPGTGPGRGDSSGFAIS